MAKALSAIKKLKIMESVLECSHDAVFVKDTNGAYVFVNGKAARDHFGKTKKEIIGCKDEDLFTPERVKKIKSNDQKVINSHTVIVAEEVFRADGDERYFRVTKTPLLDNSGRVKGIVGVSEEVTHNLRSAKEHRQLATIIETTQDAIYSLSVDGLVTSWNKAAEKLFGYSKEEIIDQPVEVFLIPDDLKEETKMIWERIRGGEIFPPYTTQRLHRNGLRITVRISLSPLNFYNGAIEGFSVIARKLDHLSDNTNDLGLSVESELFRMKL